MALACLVYSVQQLHIVYTFELHNPLRLASPLTTLATN